MPRLFGELNHDECAPWCDHNPEHHAEDCADSFCDGYECWKTLRRRFHKEFLVDDGVYESGLVAPEQMKKVVDSFVGESLYMIKYSINPDLAGLFGPVVGEKLAEDQDA